MISNTGLIRSVAREFIRSTDKKPYKLGERILNPTTLRAGYLNVIIINDDGVPSNKLVHRLVAETWIENSQKKPQVNHINGVKTDNMVENLEWCTAKENTDHMHRIGLQDLRGAKNPRSKLSESDVITILKSSEDHKKVSIQFNVSSTLIRRIRQRIVWKHIDI